MKHPLFPLLLALGLLTATSTPLRSQEPQADPQALPRLAPTPPQEAMATFEVHPDYRLEMVACEPQVVDPIALSWDARGRLFVVEMRGYSERRKASLGRIRMLEDQDGDGFYETSQVFAEGLQWPTGVLCYGNGVFVIATPDLLFLADTDGDGKADKKEVIFTGFGENQTRLNVQALANSLTWGIDGRIHGATAMNGAEFRRPGEDKALSLRGRDFSFDPRTLDLRAEPGGGQYGLTFDDWGHKFVCSNSHHMQWIAHDGTVPGLPSPLVDIPDDGPAAEVFRISPDEPWRLVRTRWRVSGKVPGPVEGGGRVSGYFTAATGICSHGGDLFTADAGSNLVHRKILEWKDRVQPVATRPEGQKHRELLASRDNWFRPVYLTNGPDGALYVADMYREIIEHPWSLPQGIKQHLDLNAGHDRGRIYRITRASSERPASRDLTSFSTKELVETLESPVPWRRLTAARLLLEQDETSAALDVAALLVTSERPETRLLALHCLAAWQRLSPGVWSPALSDRDPRVRVAALHLARRLDARQALLKALSQPLRDPSPQFRFAALLALHRLNPAQLETLNLDDLSATEDAWNQAALKATLGTHAPQMIKKVLASKRPLPAEWLRLAAQTSFDGEVFGQLNEDAQGVYLQACAEAGHALDDLLPQDRQQALIAEKVKIAGNSEASLSERLDSLTLLGAFDDAGVRARFLRLLSVEKEPAILKRLVTLLAEDASFDIETNLLERWNTWPATVQERIIDLCLRGTGSTQALLKRIESERIRRSSVTGGQLVRLQNHRDSAIRQRARDLFAPKTKAEREAAVVAARPALQLEGISENGKVHYEQRCATCHDPAGNEGQSLGPNRRALSQNGKERLLINLIDPNREVLPGYFASVVTLNDGTAASGILLSESSSEVVVRQPGGLDRAIPRDAIESILTEQHSVMPEGLEAGLSHQDLADLLSYLALE